jgi:hypothetical protein
VSKAIPRGTLFRHFKGGHYEFMYEALDSENPTNVLVIYRSLNDGKIWARSKEMFFGTTVRDGRQIPRFTRVTE